MGAKRTMLGRGLDEIVERDILGKARFVDLFTGSGAVSWHVARKWPIEVVACDIQDFATVLARAVVGRTGPLDGGSIWSAWNERASDQLVADPAYRDALQFETLGWIEEPARSVEFARGLCGESDSSIVSAYGGYYFSPLQALTIDSLRRALPSGSHESTLALAALLRSALECAAAPGHTAQPFGPSPTAAPYLFSHWRRSVTDRCKRALLDIAPLHALKRGQACVVDAITMIDELKFGDVAFIDPPYSDVQYSRFYHVLETLARGSCGTVSGSGRYPPVAERPQSDFSVRSKAWEAFIQLFERLSSKKIDAIVTFPAGEASNGVSGERLGDLAREWFPNVAIDYIEGQFSTLGGNRIQRAARTPSRELVLSLSWD